MERVSHETVIQTQTHILPCAIAASCTTASHSQSRRSDINIISRKLTNKPNHTIVNDNTAIWICFPLYSKANHCQVRLQHCLLDK